MYWSLDGFLSSRSQKITLLTQLGSYLEALLENLLPESFRLFLADWDAFKFYDVLLVFGQGPQHLRQQLYV